MLGSIMSKIQLIDFLNVLGDVAIYNILPYGGG